MNLVRKEFIFLLLKLQWITCTLICVTESLDLCIPWKDVEKRHQVQGLRWCRNGYQCHLQVILHHRSVILWHPALASNYNQSTCTWGYEIISIKSQHQLSKKINNHVSKICQWYIKRQMNLATQSSPFQSAYISGIKLQITCDHIIICALCIQMGFKLTNKLSLICRSGIKQCKTGTN